MRCSTRSAMRLWSSAPSTAIPTASPSCRAVLLMPDARPPCAGGSTPRWAKVTSGFASPVPAPTTISPASRCSHDESAPRPVISTRPPAHSAIPSASPAVSGTRALRRPATSETTKATIASGASHSPTSTGDPRRTSSRNSDRYTNAAERAAGQRGDDHRGAEERPVAEQPQVEHRRGHAQLHGGEGGEEGEPERDEPEHGRARPPERVAAQHRVDDEEEPGRQRADAGPVDRLRVRVARLADLEHREHGGRQPEHEAERRRSPASRTRRPAARRRAGPPRTPAR